MSPQMLLQSGSMSLISVQYPAHNMTLLDEGSIFENMHEAVLQSLRFLQREACLDTS